MLNDNAPRIIRILNKFHLIFNSSNDSSEINTPLLIVSYEDVNLLDIAYSKSISISFAGNNSKYMIIMSVFFFILTTLLILLSIFQTYIRYKNDFTSRRVISLIKVFFKKFLKNWSFGIFYFLMFNWFLWLLFLKANKGKDYIFPSSYVNSDIDDINKIVVIVIFIFLLIWVIWEIFVQSNLRIKIIDWEAPNLKKYDKKKGEYKIVSSWRFLSFCNEFREEMTNLNLPTGYYLLLLNFIFIGFGLDSFSKLSKFGTES